MNMVNFMLLRAGFYCISLKRVGLHSSIQLSYMQIRSRFASKLLTVNIWSRFLKFKISQRQELSGTLTECPLHSSASLYSGFWELE